MSLCASCLAATLACIICAVPQFELHCQFLSEFFGCNISLYIAKKKYTVSAIAYICFGSVLANGSNFSGDV